MLEIRPCCEHCGKDLPNTATNAMICSFECTYCKACAIDLFENVCPSCGGNFEKRPIRPLRFLPKHPPASIRKFDPKDIEKAIIMTKKFKHIKPEER